MWTFTRYVFLSTIAASIVGYHAFYSREQFFPSVVYLSTSKLAVAVMGNMTFAIALCLYRLTIRIFLGTLRDGEIERLNERVSSAIMETCLAMTIFREEFTVWFTVMFAIVTFIKIFHWLVQDRIEYLEVTPHVSRIQHFRILSFMLVLAAVDVKLLQYTLQRVIHSKGRTFMLLFTFEYLIQISAIFSSIVKYSFGALDSFMEGRWESKGVYVFYLELLTDLVHLCVYLIFFGIVLLQYGIPIHLLRDLYSTIRNFRNRVRDFLRYRRVTSRMDLFPDAVEGDLQRCDNVCIICREEMTMATVNKKLPCTHVFHIHCLRSWLERQQNCPICRNPVFPPPQRPQQAEQPPAQQGQAAEAPPPIPNLNPDVPQVPDQPVGRRGDNPMATSEPPIQQEIPTPADVNQVPRAIPLQQLQGQFGVVWNYPNVLPITSMATFVNGQIQYAGQQNPEPVMNADNGGRHGVPFVPMLSFSAPITLMPPNSDADRLPAAAAVAAAAYSPYTGLVMMPPVTYIPQSGRPEESSGQEGPRRAVQAAAAASAASGMAAAFSAQQPLNFSGTQSLESAVESVQRQLEYLNGQMMRGRSRPEGPSGSAPAEGSSRDQNEVAEETITPLPNQDMVSAADGRPSSSGLRQRHTQRSEDGEGE